MTMGKPKNPKVTNRHATCGWTSAALSPCSLLSSGSSLFQEPARTASRPWSGSGPGPPKLPRSNGASVKRGTREVVCRCQSLPLSDSLPWCIRNRRRRAVWRFFPFLTGEAGTRISLGRDPGGFPGRWEKVRSAGGGCSEMNSTSELTGHDRGRARPRMI